MRGAREVAEVNEVNEVKEKSRGVAAFFDLDGTLVALPSLEQRLFLSLRQRGLIPAKNYFLWLKEALWLIPRGISAIFEANKMHLHGLEILDERGEGDGEVSSWHKDGHQAEGQASAPVRRHPRLPVPPFFAEAIERVAWHGKQRHEIVLISGTLEPLAQGAARTLEAELAARGITVTIRVIATRMEERGGHWTGRVLGEAMMGERKARAVKRLAEEMGFDVGRCYAYGDSLSDRWLMAAVGRPAAVNPSNDLRSMALSFGWPILIWEEKEKLETRSQPRYLREEKAAGGDRRIPVVAPLDPLQ